MPIRKYDIGYFNGNSLLIKRNMEKENYATMLYKKIKETWAYLLRVPVVVSPKKLL